MTHNDSSNEVIERVRRALGHTSTPTQIPAPPAIDEPITRLVHMDVGLPELFAKRAAELKMKTEFLTIDDLTEKLIAFLQSQKLKRIMVADVAMFERLGLVDALRDAGFDAKR